MLDRIISKFVHSLDEQSQVLKDINERLESLEKHVELSNIEVLNETNARFSDLADKLTLLPNSFSIQSKCSTASKDSTTNKKRLLIGGFFGGFNLGDEIMLETILEYLKTDMNIEITIMLTNDHNPDITRYGAYNFITRPTRTQDINVIASYYDGFIIAGGALLDDAEYGISKDYLSLDTALINLSVRFIDFQKACMLYGLSTNTTFTNPEFINKLDYICKSCSYIAVRDTNSIKTIKEAGIDIRKLHLVHELIFSNKLLAKKIATNSLFKISTIKDIGLIYIFTDQTYSKLAAFTKKILRYSGDDVRFNIIPFYDFKDNDFMMASRLVEEISSKRLSICDPSPKSLAQLIDILSGYIDVISMRYHGTLIANILGKNVLCINYDKHPHYPNKNAYIYDRYQFDKLMVDFSTITDFTKNDFLEFYHHAPARVDLSKIYKQASLELRAALSSLIRN